MKNNVIFFDLFDTLVHADRGYLEEFFDKEIDKLGDRGILKDSKMTINEIVKKYPEVLNKHTVDEMVEFYDNTMKDSILNVREDVLEMLSGLKELGYRLCIVSDASYVDVKYFDESPISKYIDETIFSCECGITKPDQKIYQIALDKMSNPSNSIFIGDGGHDELVGAKEAGMKTVKVEWFRKHPNYKSVDNIFNVPLYVVKSVERTYKDLLITIDVDKEVYVKRISDDKVINLTGESGSGKSYFTEQWKDDDNYIIIDTDIVFNDGDSDNMESVEVRKLFEGVNKDYAITNFDDFYLKILDYFKDSDKYIVIDSAQYRNIKDISILKGEVIVMRTCINKCYERCIKRWLERNRDYNQEELDKFKQRKSGMFKWYNSLNTFLIKLENI